MMKKQEGCQMFEIARMDYTQYRKHFFPKQQDGWDILSCCFASPLACLFLFFLFPESPSLKICIFLLRLHFLGII